MKSPRIGYETLGGANVPECKRFCLCVGGYQRFMWRKGDPVNPVLQGYLWVCRILIFVLAPILVLALIAASQQSAGR
jgi:hypothetical protein